MARNRQYSEDDKATALAALAANDGNVLRTAQDLGIPEPTIRKWKNGQGVVQEVVQKCERKKEELSSIFDRAARVYLEHAMNPETLARVGGKDAIIAAATATDKKQLLNSLPTTIHGTKDMTDDDEAKHLDAIRKRVHARRLGLHDAGGSDVSSEGSSEAKTA